MQFTELHLLNEAATKGFFSGKRKVDPSLLVDQIEGGLP